MDGKTKLLKERVQGTCRSWMTDAEGLREAIQQGLRENGGNLLVYSALAKCERELGELMGRFSGMSAVLCVLGVADKAKEL